MYNQTLATTTAVCTIPATGYCNTYVTTTETTYNYFDLLILLFLPIMTFVIIGIFKKRK